MNVRTKQPIQSKSNGHLPDSVLESPSDTIAQVNVSIPVKNKSSFIAK